MTTRLIAFSLLLAIASAFSQSLDQPDPKLTPGAIIAGETGSVLCGTHFTTKAVRNVPVSEKREVFRRYGIAWADRGQYEIDHLISLELGGSNDIKNLFPMPWTFDHSGFDSGAHTKDRLENVLHRLVCHGVISLKEAQYLISHNWLAAYAKYVGPFPKFDPKAK